MHFSLGGEIGRRNGLEEIERQVGNRLLDPIKVGEPLDFRGNAEPILPTTAWTGRCRERTVGPNAATRCYGGGALQTPNARKRGDVRRSGYENPLAARSCRFDPGPRHHSSALQREARGRRYAPDVDRSAPAA